LYASHACKPHAAKKQDIKCANTAVKHTIFISFMAVFDAEDMRKSSINSAMAESFPILTNFAILRTLKILKMRPIFKRRAIARPFAPPSHVDGGPDKPLKPLPGITIVPRAAHQIK